MIEQPDTAKPSNSNDEIDLRDLFVSLWHGKYLIVFCILISIAFASLYLRAAERKYSVNYVFKSVASENAGPNLGGLGGLASLAGVTLPSSSSGDFLTFKFLLKSEEVAEFLANDPPLIRAMFKNEWDQDAGIFRKPPDGTLSPYKRLLKGILTGRGDASYVAPNAARIAYWIKNNLQYSEDRDSGFLTLSSETSNPELLLAVMKKITFEADQLLKVRYIESAEQTMVFYQQQLSKARAREHREALAKLIAQEDQKLMLASKGTYFVAEPVTQPSVSLTPTSPKASLVLALSFVLGGFFGAAIVLIRKALK